MSRVHYFFTLVNEEGQPIDAASISILLANSSTSAIIYTSETGSDTLNTAPQITTDENGFFEFWIGDEDETYGYTKTQKFKISWIKGLLISGEIDYIDVFPSPYPEVDESDNSSSFKNKLLSNLLAYGWETHKNTDFTFDGNAGPHNLKIFDEDDFTSDSNDGVPTQQSTKAYVDNIIYTSSSVTINTGTNVLDTFSESSFDACMWIYNLKKGSNIRSGNIIACWDPSSDTVQYHEISTVSIGTTTDVSLSVDINSNNVRFLATSLSDSWSLKFKRIPI